MLMSIIGIVKLVMELAMRGMVGCSAGGADVNYWDSEISDGVGDACNGGL